MFALLTEYTMIFSLIIAVCLFYGGVAIWLALSEKEPQIETEAETDPEVTACTAPRGAIYTGEGESFEVYDS